MSDGDREREASVKERQDKDVREAAAAAGDDDDDDDDDDDNEYFEDVSGSVLSLDELQQHIVGVIGESLFNCVFNVVQVMICLVVLLCLLSARMSHHHHHYQHHLHPRRRYCSASLCCVLR